MAITTLFLTGVELSARMYRGLVTDLFGEGIRVPLRVRAAWVPDDTIKQLEEFVTGTAPTLASPGQVLPLPAPASPLAQHPAGGAA